MSPAMSALHSVGITHSMLILAVLALVAAGVIGMFWHIIVPGAIIVLVGTLFINFTPSVETIESTTKVESTKIEPVKVEKPVEFDERQAFLKDCLEMAEYKMYQCEKLWNGHQVDEPKVTPVKVDKADSSELQLLEVDNVEYKARRDETLKKPGAVVGRITYR